VGSSHDSRLTTIYASTACYGLIWLYFDFEENMSSASCSTANCNIYILRGAASFQRTVRSAKSSAARSTSRRQQERRETPPYVMPECSFLLHCVVVHNCLQNCLCSMQSRHVGSLSPLHGSTPFMESAYLHTERSYEECSIAHVQGI
jgi:hypothetical protein